MNTNTTQKPISSISLFPPNMRYEPLFLIFSDILDKGIEQFYTDQTKSVENIYNPENAYYDPEYIIKLLGGVEIAELLAEDIDPKSIAMLYPDLIKQKGKQEAIETILKIIKIQYKNLQLLRDRAGCVWLTIILEDGAVVNVGDLRKFEKLAKKFLPTCVKLRSITNCSNARLIALNADSNWDFDIATHELDNSFRLDHSKLDVNQGYAIPHSDLVLKLCVKETHYVEMNYQPIIDSSRTQAYNHYVDCSANYTIRMDKELQVDKYSMENVRLVFIKEE